MAALDRKHKKTYDVLVKMPVSYFEENCYDIMRNGSGIAIGSCGCRRLCKLLKNQNNPLKNWGKF